MDEIFKYPLFIKCKGRRKTRIWWSPFEEQTSVMRIVTRWQVTCDSNFNSSRFGKWKVFETRQFILMATVCENVEPWSMAVAEVKEDLSETLTANCSSFLVILISWEDHWSCSLMALWDAFGDVGVGLERRRRGADRWRLWSRRGGWGWEGGGGRWGDWRVGAGGGRGGRGGGVVGAVQDDLVEEGQAWGDREERNYLNSHLKTMEMMIIQTFHSVPIMIYAVQERTITFSNIGTLQQV